MINTTNYEVHIVTADGQCKKTFPPDATCRLSLCVTSKPGGHASLRAVGEWPQCDESQDVLVSTDVAAFLQNAATCVTGNPLPLSQLIHENGWRVFTVEPGNHQRRGAVIETPNLRQII